jgi:hypothetical protein
LSEFPDSLHWAIAYNCLAPLPADACHPPAVPSRLRRVREALLPGKVYRLGQNPMRVARPGAQRMAWQSARSRSRPSLALTACHTHRPAVADRKGFVRAC